MPTIISGPRTARSNVTPSNAVVSRVLDFNFASDQGIEITAVLGNMRCEDLSPGASDTIPVHIPLMQTIHLEEGTVEDIPFGDGDDADEIDTEIFFQQEITGQFQIPATAGGGGGNAASGTLYLPYRDPVLVARNITHRGESSGAGQTGHASILIFYHYVRFTTSELGLILARRN